MKKSIVKLLNAAAIVLMIIAFMVTCMTSCKTERHLVQEHYIHDTLYDHSLLHDSIYMRDSIYIDRWIAGDTLYLDKYHERHYYHDRTHYDTIRIIKTDTVSNVVEVKKPPSTLQKIRTSAGDISIVIVLIGLTMFIIKQYG